MITADGGGSVSSGQKVVHFIGQDGSRRWLPSEGFLQRQTPGEERGAAFVAF
jgi:hypothetical protein